MRGVAAVSIASFALLALCLLSRSTTAGAVYSPRTSRRVVKRLMEEAQRSLDVRARNPVRELTNLVQARTWAQAATHLAGEEGVRRATGVDPAHVVDQATRRIEENLRAVNARVPRRARVRMDEILVSRA